MWVFVLYKIGQFLSCYLPERLSFFIARFLADFFFLFPTGRYRSYREAVLHNLNLVLNFNNRSKRKYGREVFRNFANYLREFLLLEKLDRSRFFKKVTPVGIENLDAALREKKGVLLLSCHFGNWEWGGIALALCGYDVCFVVRPHKNPYTNKLFRKLRKKGKVKVVSIAHLKRVLKFLQQNKVVATLIDEQERGIDVILFGKKISLASGPFKIAYKAGALICPAFMIRDRKTGKQKGIVESPIRVRDDVEMDKALKEAAQSFAYIMEDYLKFYPDHWFLFKKKKFVETNTK